MRKVSASPYHGNMKARRLLDRGRLQFFYHSPSSKLPIRDILNEQGHGWKKEPYLEKKAENYCVRCYQVNIRMMKSNRERYLFLFTRCAYKPLKECWGDRCIVGYLRVRRFEKRWTYKRSRRKYHWAAVGDVRLVRFQDSFPLKDLVGKASAAHISEALRGIREGVPTAALPLPPRDVIRAIAVLPLRNVSRDPSQEYFADGMTESVISDLARVKALRVISRTSVMTYKGVEKSLPEIARELNVDAVLEGSVLRSGDKVRVTAQLIQASPERHIWAKSYESSLRDVLTLQSQVARSVADEIRIKLTEEQESRLRQLRLPPLDPNWIPQRPTEPGQFDFHHVAVFKLHAVAEAERVRAEKEKERERIRDIEQKDEERRLADIDGWVQEKRTAREVTLLHPLHLPLRCHLTSK